MSDPGSPEEDDLLELERTLERGLRRAPLTEAAYARIRASVTAEWRETVRPKRRWSPLRWSALAASVAAVMILAIGLLHPFATEPPIGVVARVSNGGLASRHTLLPDERRPVGAVLHAHELLLARGPVLVQLTGGGTVRMAPATRVQTLAPGQVMLEAGEIYVDLPPGSSRVSTFVVRTSLGWVEHLGTQFDVAVGQNLRIRVREGSVRLRRGSQTETAAAGTELTVSHSGSTAKRSIVTHGPEWAWVEGLEPPYGIEGRRLVDFLQWAARETGRRVSFDDERVRELAERTRLHGSISGMRPDDALETVFATTSLRYDLEDDVIKVSSGG
jgi:ferric-dicitrate binding protein FerR (iron transport regulator)